MPSYADEGQKAVSWNRFSPTIKRVSAVPTSLLLCFNIKLYLLFFSFPSCGEFLAISQTTVKHLKTTNQYRFLLICVSSL